MTPDLLARLREAQSAKRPVALLTRLPDGEQRLWPDDAVPGPLSEAAEAALRDDEAGTVEIGGEKWFVHPHNPPVRVIVVGAGHVAQALAPMAVTLGFAVTVVDPRRAFATSERFPGVSLSADWPDEAMEALVLDARTAVVTLTHDPKLDDPA
ncbi:MAG: XdhC family protein, partial [Acetobacteraceae bacterium]|nr:XdhC family protein [Acetobacteraceae bacterium]